ncbi:type IV secretory system conjugative DNA transfer family protein [Saccharothrix sp. HUAS TT1]|uniref:type IV secretory system conjugative DNA transfer family protein n=1 Tax=unclassified Saccharothrix TaxID=2593673 RepID=UPI00345C096E
MEPPDQYRTFDLAFPDDLKPQQVQAWLRTLVGTAPSGLRRIFNLPTTVFEVVVTDRMTTYRLRVQPAQADYVAAQLRTLIPGSKVTPVAAPLPEPWNEVVELGLRRLSRTVPLPTAEEFAASLLASLQGLKTGDIVLIQWVVTPAAVETPPTKQRGGRDEADSFWCRNPDEVNDRRAKLEEANFLGVLRVASRASSDERAGHLLGRIKTALGSVRGPDNQFVRRPVLSRRRLIERVNQASGSWLYPARVSVGELGSLLAWPVGQPHVAGLPSAGARHLPATEVIPRTGRVVMRSNFPGAERPVAIGYREAVQHLHVVGPTGVGKTTLLAGMARQDMEQGYGLVVIESKGDLFHAVLDAVPEKRMDDVIVLDVTDTSFPVGFNVLTEGDARSAVEELCALFEYLYRETRSVYTREVLYFGLMTLISQPGYTFVDLATLLMPRRPEHQAWRDQLVGSLIDRELKHFWQRFDAQAKAQQDRIVQPVMDRIWQLVARPEIRRIIGQSTSSFTMRAVLESNKILLVNLAGLGRDTAGLAGTLLVNALWSAAKRVRPKKPNFLFLDEFQSFLQLPLEPEDMIVKARSSGLGMVLSHQHLGQLPVELRAAAMANTRSKIVFQTTTDDGRVFARDFGRRVDEHDFTGLGQYEVIARLMTPSGLSDPVTGTTYPPMKPTGTAAQVRALSRRRFGRAASEVDAAIEARCTVSAMHPKKPTLGQQRWG